jgi:plastocyanin
MTRTIDGFLRKLTGVAVLFLGFSAPAATTTVQIVDFAFSPPVVNISAGDSVTWTNTGLNNHDSTSTSVPEVWRSGLLAPGGTFTFTFTNGGTFPYHCEFHQFSHPTQTGAVVVAGANFPPSVLITNPPNGAVLTAPATFALQASASDSDGIASVQFLQGATSLFIDTTFPYATTVNNLAAGGYTFSAVATDTLGAKATNSINLTVNAPPTVTITNPPNGAVFVAPASFTFGATASDPGGSVTNVQFFNGASSLGNDAIAPYAVPVTNLGAGNYTLSAVAADNQGAKATNSINITVNSNQPPSVTITNPANGSSFAAPASFTLGANATDTNGTVTNVQFRSSGIPIGATNAQPFTLLITNLAAGNYSFTAVASDDGGLSRTSSAISVAVFTNAVLTNFLVLNNGQAQFDVIGIAGQIYFFDASTNLSNWISITNVVATNSLFNITDPAAATNGLRFYRGRQQPTQ